MPLRYFLDTQTSNNIFFLLIKCFSFSSDKLSNKIENNCFSHVIENSCFSHVIDDHNLNYIYVKVYYL